jgi:uncharacterized membrane protein
MSSARLPKIVFLVLVLIAVAEAHRGYTLLPNCMASHFDAAGNANNFQPKSVFLHLNAVVTVLALVTGFIVPRIISVLPASMINLPHKDYWLAPERRAQTMAFFETHFGWFGCAVYFLLICVFEEVVQANLRTPPRMSSDYMIGLLLAFAVFMIVWFVLFIRRLRGFYMLR